ncbi:MAG: EAL domain-containing protein, partial [Vicinamibacteria bacterium]
MGKSKRVEAFTRQVGGTILDMISRSTILIVDPRRRDRERIARRIGGLLRKACTQARAWQFAGLSHLRVSVNLSPKQVREKELPRRVESILSETGLHPRSLELELTESVLMDDQKYSGTILAQLKNMGALIALDDFGTGYSSMSYLCSFPIDILKIDRSFVHGVRSEPQKTGIVRAIVELGRILD